MPTDENAKRINSSDDEARTLVLDYLGQEGFFDIRDQVLALTSKSESPMKKRKENVQPKPRKCLRKTRKENFEPKKSKCSKKKPKTVLLDCDSLIFEYLNCRPEFCEVAQDFQAVRGPFVSKLNNDGNSSSERTKIEKKKKKKKSAQSDDDCQILKVKKKKKKLSQAEEDDCQILEVKKKLSQPDNDCEILEVKKKKKRKKLPIESRNPTDEIISEVQIERRTSGPVMPIFKKGSLEKDLVKTF